MFILYLLGSCFAIPSQFKSFDLMLLTDDSRLSDCNRIKSTLSSTRNQCQSVDVGDEDYENCQIIYKLYDMQCVTEENINNELTKISKNLDLLMLLIDRTSDEIIDFNNLPEQMAVLISPDDDTVITKASNVLEIVKKMTIKKVSKSNQKADIKTAYQPISIIGAIKDKVSSLFITKFYDQKPDISLKICQTALDVDSLFLDDVTIADGSSPIDVKYLYILDNVYISYPDTSTKYLFRYSELENSIKINYLNNGIQYQTSSKIINAPTGDGIIQGIISSSLNYEIVQPTADAIISPINITIADISDSVYEVMGVYNKLIRSKQKIVLSGDEWVNKNIPADYKIIVAFDEEKYELDYTNLHSSLQEKVVIEKLYKYPYKSYNGPLIGGDSTNKYGYIFDLSKVSSNIIVKYERSDQKDKGKQIASHGIVTLKGNNEFTISVYATIEGKCTDGYITEITASKDTGSGFQKMIVSDDDFSACSGGDSSGGDTTNKYKSFDLMFSIQSAKMENCNNMKSQISNFRQLCKSITSKDDEYEDCQVLAKMNEIHCILQDKINEGLSNLPSGKDLLILLIDDDPTQPIDFNKMKEKRIVILGSDSDTVHSENLMYSLRNLFSHRNKRNKLDETMPGKTLNVELVGNIREHVSFLILSPIFDPNLLKFKITESPLDVENVLIIDSIQSDDSLPIKSKYVYDLSDIHTNRFLPTFKAEQLLTVFSGSLSTNKININFGKDKISFNDVHQQIGYSDKVGIVSEANTYVLSADNDAVLKSLNITQYDFTNSMLELKTVISYLLEEKQKITIKSNLGDVDLPEGFEITVTCDKSKYDVDTKALPEKLRNAVKIEEIPKYQNKQPENKSKSLPLGAIIGIAVAAVIVVGVAIFLGVWFGVIRKRRKDNSCNEQNESAPKNEI